VSLRRRDARRTLGSLVAVALVLLSCSDADEVETTAPEPTDEVEVIVDDVLTACLDAPVEPFVTLDDDGYGGFEVAVLREVAERLELALEIEPASVEEIQSGAVLAEERCDLGGSALQITDRRAEQVAFSRPYFQTRQALIVADERREALLELTGIEPSASLDDLGVLDDAEGLRLGVRAESEGSELAAEQLDDVEVVVYDEPGDLLPALLVDDVHLVLRDLTGGAVEASALEGVEVVATLPTGRPYAFALRAGRTDGLQAAVDEALAAMQQDSTRDALFEEAFDVES
jgi:polar amino acid transport system substrate-binding protein